MPIHLPCEIRRLSQQEFGEVAYEVMRHAFDVHRDLGRLFDERIYQREIAFRLRDAQREVPIELTFDGYSKAYFLDLLVADGGIFEMKTVEALSPRHRAQLLNYLLLAETAHGKLINMRPEKVEHEFVNTSLTRRDRAAFAVEDRGWKDLDAHGMKEWAESLLRDWGVGLDLEIYEEAIVHYCGPSGLAARIEIRADGHPLGLQDVQIVSPDTALRLSAIPSERHSDFEAHLRRFLSHTSLRAIQWINLTRALVQFKTIC